MLNLTQQERKVVFFLISVALLGIGINFLAKRYSVAKRAVSFDQNIGKIDLNGVNQEALVKIPGIGEKLAKRIIEYREENAGFSKVEELRNIKGISESRYGQIKDYLMVK